MKHRKTVVLSIVMVALLSIGVGMVNAYVSYPEKWTTNTVTYDQSALSPGWASAIWEGARQWNNVSPSPFSFSATNLGAVPYDCG
jgi:hypothetical protein